MKPITLLCTALLAVAGFGAGLVVGRHHPKSTGVNGTSTAAGTSTAPGQPLPAITAKPRRTVPPGDKPATHLSLAEIESALAELKGLSRDKLWERVNEIVKGVDPADIPRVMAMLSNRPDNLQNSLRYQLLPRWAESDPRAAMEFANGLKNLNERHQAILSVLRGWAKNDLQAALAWIQQLPPGRLRNEAPGVIASILAEKDPEAAFALIKNSKLDRNFGYGSFYSVFDVWAGNDPAAAAAKAGEIKNAQQRQHAYQSIARRWAEKDVQAALTWAKSLPDGRDRSSALGAVLGAWGATDPKSAADTALALPAGQSRNNAISSIASQWAQSDLTAAVAWMQQLPEGPARQAALSSIGSQWAQNDPQGALAYAENLPTGSKKNSLLTTIATQMAQQDPEAALKWAQNLPPRLPWTCRRATSVTTPSPRSPAVGRSRT